jgi:methionine-rich copper-binding protein CopC
MKTIRAFAAASLAAGLLLFPAMVRAHAFLDHSDPAVGSTESTAPSVVHIWFTQELEPAFSSASVSDKSGTTLSDGPAVVDPNNKSELDIKLKPLSPGTYTVHWHVLSVDTHTTQGDFTFEVKKG